MAIIWTCIFFLLLFIEIITASLVSIWFVIGAFCSLLLSLVTDNILIQMAVFIVVSIISLLLTRSIVKRFNNNKFTPTNLDRVIGKVGEVVQDITSNNYGQVKVLGNIWTATSSSNKSINKGSKVVVDKIEGVKLIVRKKEEDF